MRLSITRLLLLISLNLFSGCAEMVSTLRRDFEPRERHPKSTATYGGPMAEGGFLAETMGEAGYSDNNEEPMEEARRGLASSSEESDERNSRADREEQAEGRVQKSSGSSKLDFAESNSGRVLYKKGMRATRFDFIDESPNEGSLWASDGQINYYFTKNKIHAVGDIVTLSLDDHMIRDIGLEIRGKLNPLEIEKEIELTEVRLNKNNTDLSSSTAANGSSSVKDLQEKVTSLITEADIDLTQSLEIKTGDQVLAEVIERYPNGNYKIRASKRIPYKNGVPRMLTIFGVVRGSDINEEDVVSAGKLYEYRLEATL